jgi:hypothetical protein
MPKCPICDAPVPEPRQDSHFKGYDCPRCGRWSFPIFAPAFVDMLNQKLGNWNPYSVHLRSRLSHIVRRQQRTDAGWVQMPLDDLEAWHLEDALPSPSEQLDELIVWLGDLQPSSAESAVVSPFAISAWIGTAITRQSPNAGLAWLLEQEGTAVLVESRGEQQGSLLLRLKMPGWMRYQTLKRSQVESRRVLMAMQFGDTELDHVVERCFRPAVTRTGFELRTIIEKQPAGLIDDQLRVALRSSRFIIADLTHGNNGAYWESGFAEGLGRPVIYTCRAKEWSERKPHFDANHLVTVIWDASKLEQAGKKLAATIRATLPAEAKMSDE